MMKRLRGIVKSTALVVSLAGCAHVRVNPGIHQTLNLPSGYDLSVSVIEVGVDPVRARPDLENAIAQELAADLNGIVGRQIEDNHSGDKDLFDRKRKFLDWLWYSGPEKATIPTELLPVDGDTGARIIISVRSLTTGRVLGVLTPLADISASFMGKGPSDTIDSDVLWAVLLPNQKVALVGRRQGNDLGSASERRKLFKKVTSDIKRNFFTGL